MWFKHLENDEAALAYAVANSSKSPSAYSCEKRRRDWTLVRDRMDYICASAGGEMPREPR